MSCDNTFIVPFGDTWDMSFQVRNIATGDVDDLTGASVKLVIHNDRGVKLAEMAATVNGTTDKFTVSLDSDFWDALGTLDKVKGETHRGRFIINQGDSIRTLPNDTNRFFGFNIP